VTGDGGGATAGITGGSRSPLWTYKAAGTILCASVLSSTERRGRKIERFLQRKVQRQREPRMRSKRNTRVSPLLKLVGSSRNTKASAMTLAQACPPSLLFLVLPRASCHRASVRWCWWPRFCCRSSYCLRYCSRSTFCPGLRRCSRSILRRSARTRRLLRAPVAHLPVSWFFIHQRFCCRPPITVCHRSFCSLLRRCCHFRCSFRSFLDPRCCWRVTDG